MCKTGDGYARFLGFSYGHLQCEGFHKYQMLALNRPNGLPNNPANRAEYLTVSRESTRVGRRMTSQHTVASHRARRARQVERMRAALEDAECRARTAEEKLEELQRLMEFDEGNAAQENRDRRIAVNPEVLEAEDALLSFWMIRGGGETGDKAIAPWFQHGNGSGRLQLRAAKGCSARSAGDGHGPESLR